MRDTLADLVGAMSVVVVVAYIFTRSPMYADIVEKKVLGAGGRGLFFSSVSSPSTGP